MKKGVLSHSRNFREFELNVKELRGGMGMEGKRESGRGREKERGMGAERGRKLMCRDKRSCASKLFLLADIGMLPLTRFS